MRTGEPLEGIAFFKQLYADEAFCMELGRVVLVAGRLEAELIAYLNKKGVSQSTKNAALGKLIHVAKKHNYLTKMLPALETLKNQRNYFAHNIYALFSGLIEETILERSDLLDSDIDLFTERAWQLRENLQALAEILSKSQES